MKPREAFFQRVTASIIVPITFLPIAAVLLAVGQQIGLAPVEAAGLDLLRSWLPLVYGIGIAIGFTDGDAMAALSAVAGYVTMVSVASTVAGVPDLNVGVLGGVAVGGICTWLYRKVQHVALPEYLALFSGKRLGPLAGTLAGVGLGYIFGLIWPPVQHGILALGHWVYAAGAGGAFLYGSILRLLIPTGLHHLLIQLVDTQLGSYTAPDGAIYYGEYLRFLAGDPSAGRILSGFFVSLGFGPVGAAMAIAAEARPEQRRRVVGLMTTAGLTAAILGITEPVEFAFIFASPVLYVVHIILSGAASFLTWVLGIRAGGYALPLLAITWNKTENAWLLLPLGIVYLLVYYYSFRLIIRWLRPSILGQTLDAAAASAPPPDEEGEAFMVALGGAANLVRVDACMTRLRLVVQDRSQVDEAALTRLGASGVVLPGAGNDVQVVVGPRAGDLAVKVQNAVAGVQGNAAPPADGPQSDPVKPKVRPTVPPMGVTTTAATVLLSPFAGEVLPLSQVPDPVFAEGMAGQGAALLPTDGTWFAPVSGEVVHLFPGGHAVGFRTTDGVEVLVHVGIGTVSLGGAGFRLDVQAGDQVVAGQRIGQCDLESIRAAGKLLVTPVLVTNSDRATVTVVATGSVTAGAPLLQIEPQA